MTEPHEDAGERGRARPLPRADAWRTRRPGVFEGLPRLAFQRTGRRYVDACAVGTVLHGAAVAGFGLLLVGLYVELTPAELAVYALGLLAAHCLEGAVAAVHLRRLASPVRSWLGSGRRQEAGSAWSAAAQLPLAMLHRADLYLLGVLGAVATSLLLASLLGLPLRDALELLPLSLLLYLSSIVLRYLGLELSVRPVLEAIGDRPLDASPHLGEVLLHRRLVAAVPTVTWGTGVIVAGLMTDDTERLDRIGVASLVAVAVAALVSVWLSLVLADAVSGPIVDLRDATRRVAAGDLWVRVPVVSTDETGQLAESFNGMVAGLDERARLRDALGVLVDPALTERVLAEGTDLHGDELDATILFLDVRDFTSFAESRPPREVVAALNALFDLLVPVILRHGGHANRFLGDGLLAVFGAPTRHPDHAVRAVTAADEMVRLLGGHPTGRLRVGMGINTGRVIAGTIGGGGRRDFTVIGDAVNTAARVEALTRDSDDGILLTRATFDALPVDLQDGCDARPGVLLRGKSAAVQLYARRTA